MVLVLFHQLLTHIIRLVIRKLMMVVDMDIIDNQILIQNLVVEIEKIIEAVRLLASKMIK